MELVHCIVLVVLLCLPHVGSEITPKKDKHFLTRLKRSTTTFNFNDALYNDQWYLNDEYMNIKNAWRCGFNGTGVVITVLDTGIDPSHDEFKNRYDAVASYDYFDNDTNPTPVGDKKTDKTAHGLKVAGLAAAEANNNKCGVGIAFKANIGGVRFTDLSAEKELYKTMTHAHDHVDVYACAWGPDAGGTIGNKVGYANPEVTKALEDMSVKGRKGKGGIYVFAAGNEGVFGDSCTYDSHCTSIYTISVSNIQADGKHSSKSERCPSIIAVTYTMVTDLARYKMATASNGNSCEEGFKDTSAATGVAAGIIALTLQSNKNLSWRDMQHVIIISANSDPTKAVETDLGWRKNGANLSVSDRYGFGIMDAYKMVSYAKNWKPVGAQIKCEFVMTSASLLNIPKNSPLHQKVIVESSGCGIKFVEHVTLTLDLKFTQRKDLEISIESPLKTVSLVIQKRRLDYTFSDVKNFTTMSMHYWRENPVGTWNINFQNGATSNSSGTLNYWKLVIYGTADDPFANQKMTSCGSVVTPTTPSVTKLKPSTDKSDGSRNGVTIAHVIGAVFLVRLLTKC